MNTCFRTALTGVFLQLFKRQTLSLSHVHVRSVIKRQYSSKSVTSKLNCVSPGHSATKSKCKLETGFCFNFRQPFRNMATVSSYGSWKSPVSSELVTQNSVVFQEVHTDWNIEQSDTVYWSELRYSEAGRYVICSANVGSEAFTEWTPAGFSARTRVHEYGGGSFCVCDGNVYFINYSDQRMYVQTGPDCKPEAITPDEPYRYADSQYHSKTAMLYCVREDHRPVKAKTAKEESNSVVAINPRTQEQFILVEGADFYSCPRVSPDGKKICWIQWYHPNMPWDSAELWLADLDETGVKTVSGSAKKVVSGENVAVQMPAWTLDNELLYISDSSDWWNLYHMTKDGNHVNLLPRDEELGRPHWVFGQNVYVCDQRGNGKIITISGQELGILDLYTKDYRVLDTGFNCYSYLTCTKDGHLYVRAGSPTRFPCIIRINIDTGKVTEIRQSRGDDIDPKHFSIPKEIKFPTSEGSHAYGYFYAPQNKDYKAPDGTLPPLLVKVHGGPTGQTSSELNLKIQYFTTRGFGVLDVNYRGSTGYGRTYRHSLREKWGIYDVEDCCHGAEYLVKTGQVNPDQLCIDGGSAGGYTTLACLAFKDTFKAGVSHYGVSDLSGLVEDTHKFESRYMDRMIGPYEGETLQIYKDRSPIHNVDGINCPVAFFQGDEDKIVPPNQAEKMYNAVKAKNLPTVYVLFKGEQHGFRKAENVQMALDGEFYFFSKVFGFESADKHVKLDIVNLQS